MGKRLLSLIKKELLQLSRDKALVIILIWAFTAAPYLAANGLTMEIKNYPYVVYDQSQSPSSRELLNRFQAPYFHLIDVVYSDREIVHFLDSGKASMAIIIPPDFERRIAAEKPAFFQIISDGTLSLSATVAGMYAAQISGDYTLELLEQRGFGTLIKQNIPKINDNLRVEYNPNRLNTWFMVLVDFTTMLTMIPMLLTAAAMVREKESGTIEQLMVTPVRSFEIFLSKIIPTICIILPLSCVALFGIMKTIFGLPIAGSVILFYLVLALYIFVMSSLGIQIALVAKNLPQVIMILLLLLIPMIFLSGTFTPPEALPTWMRSAGIIIPMRYFIEFSFDVLIKGNPFSYVWPSILGLLILGSSLFSLSSWIFYKRFSK